jgi:hypothetical protein
MIGVIADTNPESMKNVKDLLNSLVVKDKHCFKQREIAFTAGSAKLETRIIVRRVTTHVRSLIEWKLV